MRLVVALAIAGVLLQVAAVLLTIAVYRAAGG